MREIKGYVFIVDFKGSVDIFGMNTKRDGRIYQIIEENRIKPYETLLDAIRGGQDLKDRLDLWMRRGPHKEIGNINMNIRDIMAGELEIKIARTKKELDSLKQKESLIVIKEKKEKTGITGILYGESLNNKKSKYKSGTPLYYNRLQPYFSNNGTSAFEKASNLIKEMESYAHNFYIAKFNLELV